MDLTREEIERWPEETQVLMDLPFCVETVSGEDCELLLTIKCGQLSPYEMVDRNGRPSLFGLDRPTYDAWAGNSTIGTRGVFNAAAFERFAAQALHPDCPLCGCEDFDGQRLVPVHDPNGYAVPLNEVTMGGFRFIGSPYAPQGTGYLIQDRDTARGLAAAINAPPRVLRFRNGAELTIHPEYVQPGDVVTLNGTQFRVGELLEDPTPAYAAMELPCVELRTGAQMAELTARQHLERARPQRRLDGRRGR